MDWEMYGAGSITRDVGGIVEVVFDDWSAGWSCSVEGG